jgi:hypothetical protein
MVSNDSFLFLFLDGSFESLCRLSFNFFYSFLSSFNKRFLTVHFLLFFRQFLRFSYGKLNFFFIFSFYFNVNETLTNVSFSFFIFFFLDGWTFFFFRQLGLFFFSFFGFQLFGISVR